MKPSFEHSSVCINIVGNSMNKKMIAILIAGFLLAVHVAMITSVSLLFREATAVMLNEQIGEDCLQRYDTSGYGNEVERSAKVIPLLVIHNGQKGYAYICYSYDVKNKDGALLCASNNIFSKWEIERVDGKWNVISIMESP